MTPSRSRTNSTTRTSLLPVLADADRLDHFGNLLDLRIDFRRADAHSGGIEGGVGAAVDDDAAVLRPFGEIAMAQTSGNFSK